MSCADFLVERLDADLELQRAGRKLGDDFAQRFRQPVGNHLEMKEMAGPIALEEEFEDGLADGDVEVERAVNELELFHAAIEQPLQLLEQGGQGNLPHRDVERRQAEFAGERAAARRLDVDDAVRDVVVGVKVVGQGELGKVRQFGGNDFGQSDAGLIGRLLIPHPGRAETRPLRASTRHTSANFKSASPVMTWSAS